MSKSRVAYRSRHTPLLHEAVTIGLLLLVPVFVHAGFFSTITSFFSKVVASETNEVSYNAQTVPLLKAAVHSDPNPSKGGGDILVSEDGALVPDSGPLGGADSPSKKKSNGEISVYIVKEGDALSQVAEMFGVTTNTILWANDIKKATGIKAGDELIILPITGVRHIVKKGDTLKSIAQKYKGDADDILAYNQLASAESISIGDTIVIPGGEVVAVAPKKGAAPVKGIAIGGGPAIAGFFAHPVPGAVRTQGIHGYNGVDLGAPQGTLVRASADGEVIISKSSGWNGGYGNYIVVKHSNGTQTLYAHLSLNSVATGAYVAQGQVVGAVGNTGRSTGNHLHFEVRGAKNPF